MKVPFVLDYISCCAIALDCISRFVIDIAEVGRDYHILKAHDKHEDIIYTIYKGELEECQAKMKSIIAQEDIDE